MTHTPDVRTWAIVAVAACSAVILAGIGLPMLRDSAEAEGGDILVQTSDSLIVRCSGPEVVLRPGGFEGEVTFTNCLPNSTLSGHDGAATWAGTNVTCRVAGPDAELRLSAKTKETYRFAVMGDSHGNSVVLAEALAHVAGCEFIIHCGDMTPSGQPSEYDAFEASMRSVPVPFLATPGNHDVKLGGYDEYTSRLGAPAYSFEYSGTVFAFVDSSDQVVSEEDIEWLGEVYAGAERKVLVTHMPAYDPFGDDHTLDDASCDRVQEFVLDQDVDAVFAGHIHAYHLMDEMGTDFLISGGAGGTLVDGVHHIVIVTVDENGFSYEKVDLAYVPPTSPHVKVVGRDGSSLNLTYEELMLMDLLEGDSSYENLYGNVAGQGRYRGVLVRDLIDLVGGMSAGDVLTVTSYDGYAQEFGYLNAYPDAAWLGIQGEMIVSLEMDGVPAPTWSDGPRLAMLPEDGLYSNSDCDLTSYDWQGYDVYESAGARWVRNTLTITVGAAP